MRVLALSVLALASVSSAHAFEIVPENIEPVRWEFNLTMDGAVDGTWAYTVADAGDRMHIYGGTTWPSANITETEDMYVDAATWAPLSLDVDGDFVGTTLQAEIRWDGTQVSGPVTIQQAGAEATTRQIDLEMTEPLFERTAFFAALRGAMFEEGDTFSLSWFNIHAQGMGDAVVTVGAEQEVTVPAGTFSVLPVEIAGSVVTNIAYMTTTVPRELVRVDVVGQPMVFELVSSTTP